MDKKSQSDSLRTCKRLAVAVILLLAIMKYPAPTLATGTSQANQNPLLLSTTLTAVEKPTQPVPAQVEKELTFSFQPLTCTDTLVIEKETQPANTTPPHTITQVKAFATKQTARPIPPQSLTSLNPDIIFTLINGHRASIGKAPFQKDDRICAIAQSRAPELYNEIFVTHTMHQGFYARNLPFWATENMAHYKDETTIVAWWLNSPIHRRAIEGDYTYSCGACAGNSCNQIFTSFQPK
jgi:uncharacterized protein YkwD